jgi:hypothetical protein
MIRLDVTWRPVLIVTLGSGLALLPARGVSQTTIERSVASNRGQNVAPTYEGFEINPDGTYSMWFGYFNRNREEHLEVPIGFDNQFEPGPADRGQPTHFVPQWQKSVFRIVVPKDFGKQKLTWRLTAHGRTASVEATLNPMEMIDRQRNTLEGGAEGENLAPTATVSPMIQSVPRSGVATFKVSASDDGKPRNQRTKQPEGLSVRWRKYRGPTDGTVTFDPPDAPLDNGQIVTRARFSRPGAYTLQAVVDDGSLLTGTYCCWVNTEVTVIVDKNDQD